MEDGSSIPLWGSLVFLILLILNGIFYGFAAAVQNLSFTDTEKKAEEGNEKAKKLLKIMENPNRYINCIPMLAVLTGISCGAFFIPALTAELQKYIPFSWAATMMLILIIAMLLTGFGILAFRRVGTYRPEDTAYRFVTVVSKMIWVFVPLNLVITWIAKLTAAVFGVALHKSGAEVTEEEILSVVDEAHEQGVIEENEAEMIQNIITFNETQAQDIMTHRSSIIALERTQTMNEAVNLMLDEGISRCPVYGEDLDDIIGVVHFKDMMHIITKNPLMKTKTLDELPELIRTPSFIPETRGIGDIFKSMQAKQIHLALVVDEYGQTAGLVTMEDILEEIVGDILDEYDEEETSIQAQMDDSILIEGLAGLEDVGEELDVDFSDLDFETLNGYLTSLLGHIPTDRDVGEKLMARGYSFQILSIDRKTIERVRAEKIKENKEETKGDKRTCQDIQNSQT
ncbi:MAG: hemolysin family protein [Eubacteriales bacterium]|nr:hemolysin family protein [Eubacteriales bacterium]